MRPNRPHRLRYGASPPANLEHPGYGAILFIFIIAPSPLRGGERSHFMISGKYTLKLG